MPLLAKDCQESQKVLSKLVAQAWLDDGLRERIILNPAAVLTENGLTVPSGVEVRVNQKTSLETLASTAAIAYSDGVYEIPLPPKPAALKDEQIRSWDDGSNAESSAVVETV